MSNEILASVDEQPKGRWSAIWILPLVAALIGVWLIYTAVIEAPIPIEVEFDSGEGIEVGKTVVRYEGIEIGKVTAVRLQPDMVGIIATIDIDRRVEQGLKKDTLFWIVKPEVTLSGVTGLGTVLSGNYIAVRIGDGAPGRYFKGLLKAPPKSIHEPGLHIVLHADDLGSLNIGSPLIYKKITIGDVQSFELDKGGLGVTINVFIKPDYAHLIKPSSRFWNASGITIKGGLTGIDIRTDSLTSVLIGGIGVSTVDNDMNNPQADNGDKFQLYKGYVEAEAGVRLTVEFPIVAGIEPDITTVIYRGIPVGQVEAVDVNQDLSRLTATLTILPRAEEHLNKNTRIWISEPDISSSALRAIGSVLSGPKIEIEFDGKEPDQTREFVALTKAPVLKKNAPGLHVIITTENLKSVSRGMNILYRSIPVGSVIDYRLSKDKQVVELDAHIEPEYAHLVNSSTHFWDSSGIQINGGLDGIKIRTSSLSSIVLGGISFYTPNAKATKVNTDHHFNLHPDYASAHTEGIPITLYFSEGNGLKSGTLIKYEGINVGKVISVNLNKSLDGVVVNALLEESAAAVAKRDTQFWLVKPELGLARTANLGTLLTGEYITFKIGKGKPHFQFTALNAPPVVDKGKQGLNIILISEQTGSVKEGVAVSYRGVTVGKVSGFSLANTADHVRIFINIEERYAPLIRENSQFWNASGLDIGFKLFGGATLKTESVESILGGGISFATPNDSDMGGRVGQGAEFRLHAERDDSWLAWKPEIQLSDTSSE